MLVNCHINVLMHFHIPLTMNNLQGCAMGTGFCAASHLDSVVLKLEQVAKNDMVRKSKGLFGLGKVCSSLLMLF